MKMLAKLTDCDGRTTGVKVGPFRLNLIARCPNLLFPLRWPGRATGFVFIAWHPRGKLFGSRQYPYTWLLANRLGIEVVFPRKAEEDLR